MDFTSIIGIIVTFGFVLYGILSGAGGSINNFIDMPSVYITIGGTIGAVILSSSLGGLKKTWKIVRIAFSSQKYDMRDIINTIIELSKLARRQGLLALEDIAEEIEDPFLKKGVYLAVDDMSIEVVRNILGTEIAAMEERHRVNRGVFDTAAAIAPAFGMIGTLIGLINMLQQLSTPEKIGPQMSVALVTTFYGAMLSNALFIPLSKKLQAKTEEEVLSKELIIEGIISILSGENPRFVEQKLLTFLPPDQRALYEEQSQ